MIPRLETMYEADARNDVLRYYLADQLLAADQLDRAEELYRNGLDTIADPRALVGIFAIQRRKGDAEQLFETIPRTFQTVPRADDEQVLQQLAPDVRDLSRRFEDEVTSLVADEQVLANLFEFARYQDIRGPTGTGVLPAYILGKLATEADRADDAIEFYRYAIGMRNDPPSVLYTELGMYLLDAKRYGEAVSLLQEAVNHPSNGLQREKWRFLFFLSYAHEFLGETEAALSVIRDAQQLMPRFGCALLSRGLGSTITPGNLTMHYGCSTKYR